MNKYLSNMAAVTYEADQFLSAFSRLRSGIDLIDRNLCYSLYQIVSEINNFLESKPMEIRFPEKDRLSSADLKKSRVRKTFICDKCGSGIGNKFNDVWNHVRLYDHKKLKKPRGKVKLDKTGLPKKTKALLQVDLKSFFAENLAVANKLKNPTRYKEIENELLEIIRPAFVDQTVKIYFFGSRLSGIGTKHSDLDIFIDIGGVFNTYENRSSDKTKIKLQIVEDLLRKNPRWSELIPIRNARVPIIKVLYKPQSIHCDIGFSNSLGFLNTKLNKYLMELQPIVRALAFFFKKWIERSKLNEYITTYSAVLLVICYFQMNKLLPPIKTLQDDVEDDLNEIGPWTGAFAEKSLADLQIPEAPYGLGGIRKELTSFFKFYSTFDFKHNIICPYLGQAISIENLEESPLLPRYVKYIQTAKENKHTLINITHMNVQDPFQQNNNVTKAVPSTIVLLLKQYFKLCLNAMAETDAVKIKEGK